MEPHRNFLREGRGFTSVTPNRVDTPRTLGAAYHDPTSLLWVP
jgi:hypothetical protein